MLQEGHRKTSLSSVVHSTQFFSTQGKDDDDDGPTETATYSYEETGEWKGCVRKFYSPLNISTRGAGKIFTSMFPVIASVVLLHSHTNFLIDLLICP